MALIKRSRGKLYVPTWSKGQVATPRTLREEKALAQTAPDTTTEDAALAQRVADVEAENRRLRETLADTEAKLQAMSSIERSLREQSGNDVTQ